MISKQTDLFSKMITIFGYILITLGLLSLLAKIIVNF